MKSAEEQALMRQAAKVTDAAAGAAIAAISDGASEQDVAAECVAAMIRAGGHAPGFGPFIRPAARLGEEHTTWGVGRLPQGRAGLRRALRLRLALSRAARPARPHRPHQGRRRRDGRGHRQGVRCRREGAAGRAIKARDVYAAWQGVVDDAGLSHYRRHHCGYLVGIGQPPSWTGGNSVTGLRHDSDLDIETGMSFHILSWLMGTGRGDDFISNTVLLDRQRARRC